MSTPSTHPNDWGTCILCGDAVPPQAVVCPTCGKPTPAVAGTRTPPTRWEHRRLRLVQATRTLVVVAVVVGLTYVMVGAVWSGPPTYSDPLTTRGTYSIAPGNFTYLSGSITGEDYIVGNYSVVAPAGTNVSFQVYNQTEFIRFVHHESSAPQLSLTTPGGGRIVFAAPYTDTFYFVWLNPFPTSSGVTQSLYAVTNYESNVVLG